MSNYWLFFAQYLEAHQRPGPMTDLPLHLRRDYAYGVDIPAIPELSWSPIVGLPVVAHALGRRFITPRGGLFYDPTYGSDLRSFLNRPDTTANRFELEVMAAREALKEPRILDVDTTVQTWGKNAIRLGLNGELAEGPFDFIAHITEVDVGLFSRPAQS